MSFSLVLRFLFRMSRGNEGCRFISIAQLALLDFRARRSSLIVPADVVAFIACVALLHDPSALANAR